MPSDEWDVFSKKTKTLVLARPRMNPADWGRLLANTMRAIDTAAERRGIERAAKWHDEVVAWAEAMLAKARGPDQEDKWKAMMREHKGMAADIRALAQPAGEKGEG